MDFAPLTSLLNRGVRLTFKNGEVVDALLLGVDPERDRDLTYEVKRVIRSGNPPARGTRVGATCIASLDELELWEPS